MESEVEMEIVRKLNIEIFSVWYQSHLKNFNSIVEIEPTRYELFELFYYFFVEILVVIF